MANVIELSNISYEARDQVRFLETLLWALQRPPAAAARPRPFFAAQAPAGAGGEPVMVTRCAAHSVLGGETSPSSAVDLTPLPSHAGSSPQAQNEIAALRAQADREQAAYEQEIKEARATAPL